MLPFLILFAPFFLSAELGRDRGCPGDTSTDVLDYFCRFSIELALWNFSWCSS